MTTVTVAYDVDAARVDDKIRAKLMEMGWTPPGEESVQGQLCARIDELESEKLALIEENARLSEELRDRYSQTRCGCSHPACKRCRDDRDTEAVLQEKSQ